MLPEPEPTNIVPISLSAEILNLFPDPSISFQRAKEIEREKAQPIRVLPDPSPVQQV